MRSCMMVPEYLCNYKVKKRYGIALGVRQCQYMFKSIGFRRRKPSPLIARADPELQETYKKTPGALS